MRQSLQTLKGVGEKTEKLFFKLGIYDTEDLIHYYPRNYDAFEAPVDIADLEEGTVKAVSAAVCSGVYVRSTGGKQIITATVADQSGKLPVIWFNMPYLRTILKKGSTFVLRGRVIKKQNRIQMEHPEVFTPAAYEEILHSLQPIYGLTSGLSNKTITKTIRQLLENLPMYSEFLSEDIRQRYQLADINYALRTIHFPLSMEELLVSRKRLVFDEFLLFILSIQMMKEKNEETPNYFPIQKTWITEQIIENLPYSLTNAQLNTWYEIERDMSGQALMSRLVQGDVGSGKTIIAFLAMILSCENGYQSALMVPTEVLAKQHYESFMGLLKQQGLDFCTVLLTGSNTAKEKREIYAKIASGEAQIIIGTHALIQEKVIYKNLSLVITDEQHRFGVAQRSALAAKGHAPHVLVMSATPIPPIPRTLAIILYGDLDISVIDELPAKRLPIKNCVVDISYRPKAYSFIQKQVQEGRQVYIICPMVEESEGLDAENVLDYTAKIKSVFPSDIQIEYLHGKMKASEKNQIMERFAANKIQILVSTTVVEVGVNVPNATVMMVENAERFGLAQLHQLRGRVGRGEHQSYCIFVQGNKEDTTSKRLEILNKSNDGFYIAGEDLKLRGPGDLFGIRQSGVMEFRIGDIYNDSSILKSASEAASEILSLDPDLTLPQNQLLKEQLQILTNRSILVP